VLVEHLGFNSSDHRPILLKFDKSRRVFEKQFFWFSF
jgi:hypothetical protein